MLTSERVTAVFDSRAEADEAISALRRMGVTDTELSVIARNEGVTDMTGHGSVTDDAGDTAERVGKGALAGAGAGTLFGLAALAIPGVGPFITAGWLASALGVTGGAMAAGAIVGGTSGAMAGLFAKAGYDEHESGYYSEAVERGGTFVAVDTRNSAVTPGEVRATLAQYGGRAPDMRMAA